MNEEENETKKNARDNNKALESVSSRCVKLGVTVNQALKRMRKYTHTNVHTQIHTRRRTPTRNENKLPSKNASTRFNRSLQTVIRPLMGAKFKAALDSCCFAEMQEQHFALPLPPSVCLSFALLAFNIFLFLLQPLVSFFLCFLFYIFISISVVSSLSTFLCLSFPVLS